jgi:Kelch motif
VALLESKIYILGGLLHHEVLLDRATSAVEAYDLETGEWSKEDAFPHHTWEHSLATLLVPVSREANILE